MSVKKDIETGALPKGEIPGFVLWWIGRNALKFALSILAVLFVVTLFIR